MKTLIYKIDKNNIDYNAIKEVASFLRQGKNVAFPTETVYGLGASAFDDNAVKNIFKIKGRPQDNPLIAHISDVSMLELVCDNVPEIALKLFEKFSPGPLTVVMPKGKKISSVVTAGGDTVAVRIPADNVANALIKECKFPIVAPSANISGKPSPTEFSHVLKDLDGKVFAIIDSGKCDLGIESTVVLPVGDDEIKILRPGKITKADLETVVKKVSYDSHILVDVKENEKVLSPGMKHRHYAPSCPLVLLKGEKSNFIDFIRSQKEKIGVICYDEYENELSDFLHVCIGSVNDYSAQSKNIFSAIRSLDETGVQKIYCVCPPKNDETMGILNRMLRASGFNILNV